MQLHENIAEFEDAGIAVIAMTYDSVDLQKEFVDKYSISFPLLSDIEASSVKTLGILNKEYEPGDSAYGIPHPGIFVVNSDMQIVGKLFVQAYNTRVDADSTLAYAKQSLAR